MKRSLVAAGAIVLLLAALASAQAPRRGGVARVGLDADTTGMDPHFASAAVDRQVYQSLYDKLVDINQNLEIVPMLATSWTLTNTGRTLTFKLRPNVVFHDGTPFNAEAVRFNFERMLEPGSFRRSEILLVQRAVVIDPLTVALELERPSSALLAVLSDRAGMMVSPTAARRLGRDFGREPIGAGPYRFVERRPQDRTVLERFDRHWDKTAGHIDRIIFRPFTDEQARLANLRAGELDIINQVPPSEIPALRTDARVRLLERAGLGWAGVWVNTASPALGNKALRQALNATIDRTTLTRVVFGETAQPANGPFPPGMLASDAGSNSKIPERNLDLARAKLREGGQPNGFTFTLKLPPGRVPQQVAQVLQAMAAEAGIRINLEIVEFGTLLSQMDKAQYDAALVGWSGRPDPDGNVYNIFNTGGGFNYSQYNNPRLDSLLEAARILSAPDLRRRAYADALTILGEDLPYLFLYWPKEFKAMSPNLQGFVHISDGMIRLRHAWLSP